MRGMKGLRCIRRIRALKLIGLGAALVFVILAAGNSSSVGFAQGQSLFTTLTVGKLAGIGVDADNPPLPISGLLVGLGADIVTLGGDVSIRQIANDLTRGASLETQGGGALTQGTYCYVLTAFVDDKEVFQGAGPSQISVVGNQQVVFRWQVDERLRQTVQFGAKAGYRIYKFGPLPSATQCTAVKLEQYARLAELTLTIPPQASLSFVDDGRKGFVGGAPQLKGGGNLTVEGSADIKLNAQIAGQLGIGPVAPAPGVLLQVMAPAVPLGKFCPGPAGNARLVVDPAGKVVIGVPAAPPFGPAGALEVAHSLGVGAPAPPNCGDALINNNLTVVGTATISALLVQQNVQINQNLNVNLNVQIGQDLDVSRDARIKGRVGIGLDKPEAKLHILAKPDDPPGLQLTSQGPGRDAIFETTTDNDLDLMLEAAGKTRFDLVTFKNGGFGIVDCTGLPSIACLAFAANPANASLLVQAGQIKLFNFSGPPKAIGIGALYFDTAANPATGDPPNTPYFWDGAQWVPLRGLKCWDLNGNGRPDLPAEDTNQDGKVDVNDCKGKDGRDGKDGSNGRDGIGFGQVTLKVTPIPSDQDPSGQARMELIPTATDRTISQRLVLELNLPRAGGGAVNLGELDRRYVLKPRDETDLTIGSLLSLGQLAGDWLVVGEPKDNKNFWSLINPDNGPDLALGTAEPPDLSRLTLTVMEFERATGHVKILKDLQVGGNLTITGALSLESLDVNGDLRVRGDTELEDLIARDAEFDNVTVNRDLRVKGVKFFVQPHPTDPTKEIAYAALEGPEAGVYLRGEAQLVDGEAVISLPEHFALVTAPQGLTAQFTPIGKWLQLYVVDLSSEKLIVREAQGKSGKFFYLIQGIRKGYESLQPVQTKRDAPKGGK